MDENLMLHLSALRSLSQKISYINIGFIDKYALLYADIEEAHRMLICTNEHDAGLNGQVFRIPIEVIENIYRNGWVVVTEFKNENTIDLRFEVFSPVSIKPEITIVFVREICTAVQNMLDYFKMIIHVGKLSKEKIDDPNYHKFTDNSDFKTALNLLKICTCKDTKMKGVSFYRHNCYVMDNFFRSYFRTVHDYGDITMSVNGLKNLVNITSGAQYYLTERNSAFVVCVTFNGIYAFRKVRSVKPDDVESIKYNKKLYLELHPFKTLLGSLKNVKEFHIIPKDKLITAETALGVVYRVPMSIEDNDMPEINIPYSFLKSVSDAPGLLSDIEYNDMNCKLTIKVDDNHIIYTILLLGGDTDGS